MRLHARTMALIADIPAEVLRQPGTIPWYGDEYALDDLIVYQYYGHKREHMAQVDKFRDEFRVRVEDFDGSQRASGA